MAAASNHQSPRKVVFPGTFHQLMFLFDARDLPAFDASLISVRVLIKKTICLC
jgi:hypothetical protein